LTGCRESLLGSGTKGLSNLYYNRALMIAGSVSQALAAMLSAHQSIGVPQPLALFGERQRLAVVERERIPAGQRVPLRQDNVEHLLLLRGGQIPQARPR
jgi:hypothetical protein